MIWYILGGVLLLVSLLLHIPVRLDAVYSTQNGGSVILRWLFIHRTLYPAPERKGPQKEKPAKEQKPGKQRGGPLFDTLEALYDALPAIRAGSEHIARRITLQSCRIRLTTAGDAAEAAIRAGSANALMYALYQVVANIIKVRHFDALAAPDYDSTRENGEASARFLLAPMAVFGGGIKFLGRGGSVFLGTQKGKDR